MRNSWTDERLDDGFARIVIELQTQRGETRAEFGSMRGEFGSLRTELKGEIGSLRTELKEEVGSLRTELHQEIGSLRTETIARFDDLNRTLFLTGGGIIAALLGVIATQL